MIRFIDVDYEDFKKNIYITRAYANTKNFSLCEEFIKSEKPVVMIDCGDRDPGKVSNSLTQSIKRFGLTNTIRCVVRDKKAYLIRLSAFKD